MSIYNCWVSIGANNVKSCTEVTLEVRPIEYNSEWTFACQYIRLFGNLHKIFHEDPEMRNVTVKCKKVLHFTGRVLLGCWSNFKALSCGPFSFIEHIISWFHDLPSQQYLKRRKIWAMNLLILKVQSTPAICFGYGLDRLVNCENQHIIDAHWNALDKKINKMKSPNFFSYIRYI